MTPLSNIAGDLERIFSEMWQQLREALPNHGEYVNIEVKSWLRRDEEPTLEFQVWNQSDFIKVAKLQERPSDASCEIPVENWDKFIKEVKQNGE